MRIRIFVILRAGEGQSNLIDLMTRIILLMFKAK